MKKLPQSYPILIIMALTSQSPTKSLTQGPPFFTNPRGSITWLSCDFTSHVTGWWFLIGHRQKHDTFWLIRSEIWYSSPLQLVFYIAACTSTEWLVIILWTIIYFSKKTFFFLANRWQTLSMALWSMTFAIFIYMHVCLDINPMLMCQFRDTLIINSINFKNLYFNLYFYLCHSAFDGSFRL